MTTNIELTMDQVRIIEHAMLEYRLRVSNTLLPTNDPEKLAYIRSIVEVEIKIMQLIKPQA